MTLCRLRNFNRFNLLTRMACYSYFTPLQEGLLIKNLYLLFVFSKIYNLYVKLIVFY